MTFIDSYNFVNAFGIYNPKKIEAAVAGNAFLSVTLSPSPNDPLDPKDPLVKFGDGSLGS